MAKRKVAPGSADDEDTSMWEDRNNLLFMPLGCGREVGRSCHLLDFKGKKLILDCGIHPGRQGDNSLPFFDAAGDLEDIDLCIISHFHLDHAAALPYLTEKTKFKGRVLMTGSTKAILRLVLKDYCRMLVREEGSLPIYDHADVERCLQRCEVVAFHSKLQVQGVNLTPYHAGHVLGAAMFVVEIAGVHILYTGDYSREDDRHLRGAEIPNVKPDVLVVESTFGLLVHESRKQREQRFTEAVEKVVRRGGNCLIPMGALGAVQELMLILEDHWNKNPELQGIPIYHTSRIANEALEVYRTYINGMNAEMRGKALLKPWSFRHIGSLGEGEVIESPAVVLASPGYLQAGKSRQLFERWCLDGKNGCILAGYAVEGTLAKDLSREGAVKEVTSQNGSILSVECEIKTITFAAHADFIGTKTFIDQLEPRNVIFVHGEERQMGKLKRELTRLAAESGKDTRFFNPANLAPVRLEFQEQRIVKAYGGELVQRRMRTKGKRAAAFLVRQNFTDRLIATEDLRLYTQLKTATVQQQLHLPFHRKFGDLAEYVGKLFVPEPVESQEDCAVRVADAVTLVLNKDLVRMTWNASPSNDMLADALTAILMQAESGIAAVKVGTCCSARAHHAPHAHYAPHGHHAVAGASEALEEASEEASVEASVEPADVVAPAASAGGGKADGGVEEKGKGDGKERGEEGDDERDAKHKKYKGEESMKGEQAAFEAVAESSQTVQLMILLLKERFGDASVSTADAGVAVSLLEGAGRVDVKFDGAGHVRSIARHVKVTVANDGDQGPSLVQAQTQTQATAAEALLELAVREVAALAMQTVHPL